MPIRKEKLNIYKPLQKNLKTTSIRKEHSNNHNKCACIFEKISKSFPFSKLFHCVNFQAKRNGQAQDQYEQTPGGCPLVSL